MENIGLLMQGFQSIFTVSTLFYCLLGVTVGTIVGVLPGLGPAGAMAILFPMKSSHRNHKWHYHAGRYLLWCDVRRIYYFYSAERPRRGCLDDYLR